MTKQFNKISIAFLVILFTASLPLILYAEHGQFPQWVNDSVNGDGNSCCGKRDCIPLDWAEVIRIRGQHADVRMDASSGTINRKAVVEVPCPGEDPRPYACQKTGYDMIITNPDGTSHLNITPDTVRCLLIPQCAQGNS